jgi:hypothetical protein
VRPFLIFGRPRSATAWMAEFLSYGAVCCLHQPSLGMAGPEDLKRLLRQNSFAISDPMLTLRWRDVVMSRPDAHIVVIQRDGLDCVRSMMAALADLGIEDNGHIRRTLEQQVSLLELEIRDLRRHTVTLDVPFDELPRRTVVEEIFRYCLDLQLPADHWERWSGQRVTADLPSYLIQMERNRRGLRRLFPELKEMIA